MPFFSLGAASVNAYWYNNPDALELQNTAGIYATVPGADRQKLIFVKDGANVYGLLRNDDGVNAFNAGTGEIAGTKFCVLSFATTGKMYSVSVTDNDVSILRSNAGVSISEYSHNAAQISEAVQDLATDNSLRISKTADGLTAVVSVAGVDTVKVKYLDEGLQVTDGADAVQFQVTALGEILTNQAQAPGVHPTLNKEVPLFDTAGNLLGYIPVMI